MWGWLSFLCLIKVPIMPSLKSFYSPCVCSLCLQSNSQQISQGASWLNNCTLNRSTLGVSFHNTCLFLTNPFHLHSVDVALPMDHNSWDRWFDGASSKWCLLRQPVSFSIQIWCIKSPEPFVLQTWRILQFVMLDEMYATGSDDKMVKKSHRLTLKNLSHI